MDGVANGINIIMLVMLAEDMCCDALFAELFGLADSLASKVHTVVHLSMCSTSAFANSIHYRTIFDQTVSIFDGQFRH
jgi:hypothetical protein